MSIYWDKCNKWLYIGIKWGQANQVVIMLDDWLGWYSGKSNNPTIRAWNLFQVMWDNGAWWGFDLDKEEKNHYSHMNGKYVETIGYTKKSGQLDCFFQIKIVGIGLRINYKRKASVFIGLDLGSPEK